MRFQGAIFDVDGVLVDSLHSRTWREALRELMDTEWVGIHDRTSYSPKRFTQDVYQQVITAGRGSPAPGPRSTTSAYTTPTAGPSAAGRASRNTSPS
ncbi:MAG TPA: hypothetical protein VE979_25485 [Streptosporangiaceae bacterium]|nr:hypothetical protein [Streptosporangiaceae bacterium]